MLTPQTVIDFEGFCFLYQPFIVKELSVQVFDYNDIILLKPPFLIHPVDCQGTEKFCRDYDTV